MPDALAGHAARRRWLLWSAVGLSVAYVAVWAFAASRLTFYYDDYFLILAQHDRTFVDSLITGINGNWWPLATLLQRVEVWLFGPWYVGYLVVNALLTLAIVWLAWFAISSLTQQRRWLALPALALYACSLGVLVNVSVMTASWPMSVALAMLSCLLLVRRRPAWLWIGALALSFLADSGLFAVNATIVAAVFVVDRFAADTGRRLPSRGDIGVAVVLAAAGLVGTFVGNAIASQDPIDYYDHDVSSTGALLPSVHVVDAAQTTFAFAVPWLSSPLVPFSAIRNAFLTWQVVLVADHLLFFLLCLVLTAAAAGLIIWRSAERRTPTRALVAGLVLAVPVIETAVIVAVVRTGSGFAPRYALVWLLAASILWAIVLSRSAATASGRVVYGVGRGLLVASALVAVVLLPVTTRDAIDTDNARWEHTANQVAQLRACLRTGGTAVPDPDVSPGISATDFCRFAQYVRHNSLLGGLLD